MSKHLINFDDFTMAMLPNLSETQTVLKSNKHVATVKRADVSSAKRTI